MGAPRRPALFLAALLAAHHAHQQGAVVAVAAPPAVHTDAAFEVKEQLGLPYGQGVLCNAKHCIYCTGGLKANGPKGCSEACQNPEPGPAGPAAPGCPMPQKYNLTLDLCECATAHANSFPFSAFRCVSVVPIAWLPLAAVRRRQLLRSQTARSARRRSGRGRR